MGPQQSSPATSAGKISQAQYAAAGEATGKHYAAAGEAIGDYYTKKYGSLMNLDVYD